MHSTCHVVKSPSCTCPLHIACVCPRAARLLIRICHKGDTVKTPILYVVLAMVVLWACATPLWSQTNAPPHVFSQGKYVAKEACSSANTFLRKLSARSGVPVIDTAIIRSTRDTTRHLYSFNANAQRTLDVTQRWTANIWVDSLRETNTYDASNNMLSHLDETWSNGEWVREERFTYTYDACNNRLSCMAEPLSEGNTNWWRDTCAYDARNNMLSDVYEFWSHGQWLNSGRYTYTYDARNNVLSTLLEGWSPKLGAVWTDGQWINLSRDTCTYDARNNMLSEVGCSWSNDQWVDYSRTTYTYDATNNRLTDLLEHWSDGQWVNAHRHTRTYDASNNMLSCLYEECSNGQWVNVGRDTYTYDANGNMLTDLFEQWSSGQWVNDGRYTYAYDSDRYLTSAWHYLSAGSSWVPSNNSRTALSDIYVGVADSAGNEYSYYVWYNVDLSYKINVTGIASESGKVPASYSLLQNYPNPFNPSTKIGYRVWGLGSSWVRLAVYDMLGREVAVLVNEEKEAGFHEVRFDASGLSSGVYVYRMQVRPLDSAIGRDSRSGAGDFVQSKKLVLVK